MTLTIVAAFVLMGLSIVLLLIGKLITGKTRLRRGCGKAPQDKGKGCTLCGSNKSCEKDENEKNNRESDGGSPPHT